MPENNISQINQLTNDDNNVGVRNIGIKSKKPYIKFSLALSLVLFLLAFLIFLYKGRIEVQAPFLPEEKPNSLEVKKFKTDSEFKEYLSKDTGSSDYLIGSTLRNMASPETGIGFDAAIGSAEPIDLMPGGQWESLSEPNRVSETNVQVAGIDEPDIVKTDGKHIYYSNNLYGILPVVRSRTFIEDAPDIDYQPPQNNTKVINAYPPEEVKTVSTINETGEMLLFDEILLNISGNKLSGYDVSDPSNPQRKWLQELEENVQIQVSRKFNNKLYVIAKTYVYRNSPCPVPLVKGGVNISCTDIFYPPTGISSDTTYTVLLVNPNDGAIENKVSFLGKQGISVVYMSENHIYISFTYYESYIDLILDLFKTKGEGLVPEGVIERLEKVASYEISEGSKMNEFGQIIEEYTASLSSDEKKKLENEMQNKMEDYMKDHARDLQKTGIVRFDNKDLGVASSVAIPGTPLNQFSMDEYKGYLRIATTTSNSFTGSSDSFNDVYILDDNLNIKGSITDLGLGERIYSARFIEDKGYLVTFRQIDPFYVLDLSDPADPKMTGELKIPGYSSYLHPLMKDKILGVGQEGSNAKVSLFDVSNPNDPKEVSKYDISEYWSEVSSNHHAFLQDAKHSVFFMPAGQNGYIFSYKNDTISLEKVITNTNAVRALYIKDYLYILGSEKMVVLDEGNWEEVRSYDYK